MPERRTTPRKKFSFYMRVLNDDTHEILGHMVEVGEIGLQLETIVPLPLQKDYYLRHPRSRRVSQHGQYFAWTYYSPFDKVKKRYVNFRIYVLKCQAPDMGFFCNIPPYIPETFIVRILQGRAGRFACHPA